MRKDHLIRLTVLATFILTGFGLTGCQGKPRSVEECVLQHVKSGMSDFAAAAALEACEDMFAKCRRPLHQAKYGGNESELNSIKGSLCQLSQGRAKLTLYNGLETSMIKSVEIEIVNSNEEEAARKYLVNIKIAAHAEKSTVFDATTAEDFTWSITEAWLEEDKRAISRYRSRPKS